MKPNIKADSIVEKPTDIPVKKLSQTLMNREDLVCIATHAKNKKRLVEIGVFKGGSAMVTRRMMAPNAALFLVDPYITMGRTSTDKGSLEEAKANVEPEKNGKVIWITDRSLYAERKFLGKIDYLLIDGDHSYKECKIDWTIWSPHVSPGGVVIFHDTNRGEHSPVPGPQQVVDELFADKEVMAEWELVEKFGWCTVLRRKKKSVQRLSKPDPVRCLDGYEDMRKDSKLQLPSEPD